jgi:hypothetical protein
MELTRFLKKTDENQSSILIGSQQFHLNLWDLFDPFLCKEVLVKYHNYGSCVEALSNLIEIDNHSKLFIILECHRVDTIYHWWRAECQNRNVDAPQLYHQRRRVSPPTLLPHQEWDKKYYTGRRIPDWFFAQMTQNSAKQNCIRQNKTKTRHFGAQST